MARCCRSQTAEPELAQRIAKVMLKLFKAAADKSAALDNQDYLSFMHYAVSCTGTCLSCALPSE